eukprot:SAG31_NODE_178_length_21247_cov_11.492009_19_plen_66_part_00
MAIALVLAVLVVPHPPFASKDPSYYYKRVTCLANQLGTSVRGGGQHCARMVDTWCHRADRGEMVI